MTPGWSTTLGLGAGTVREDSAGKYRFGSCFSATAAFPGAVEV